ncbi:MAG: DUF998 domain-containing protein [Candidatus Hermodarchaeota archaeon]
MSIEKLLKLVPGGVFGLLSVIIIVLGEFLAFLFFPGYNVLENMISDLGIGPGGLFFNLSVIVSGIIIIPYYVNLANSFSGEKLNINLKKFAITVAIISCLTYSLLGVFPSDEDWFIIYFTHGTLAAISIGTGLLYLISYSKLMIQAENFSKIQGYHGFIVSMFYFTFLITWIPIVEWMMNLAILSWIAANSIYILYKRY